MPEVELTPESRIELRNSGEKVEYMKIVRREQ